MYVDTTTNTMLGNIRRKSMLSNLPFSICWRKCVKMKYINPLKKQQTKYLRQIVFLGGFSFVFIFFLFSSTRNHNSVLNDFPFYILADYNNRNSIQAEVYEVISSWTLQENQDTSRLPILSSSRDKSWLYYPKGQLLEWHDVPNDFVHDQLKRLRSSVSVGKNMSYGDLGNPIFLKDHLLTESKSKMSLYQLNVVASDLMSLNRRLMDMRPSR